MNSTNSTKEIHVLSKGKSSANRKMKRLKEKQKELKMKEKELKAKEKELKMKEEQLKAQGFLSKSIKKEKNVVKQNPLKTDKQSQNKREKVFEDSNEKIREIESLNEGMKISKRIASEKEKQNWKNWYDEAKKLSNEMMLLTGGPSGMVRLKDLYEEAEDKFIVSEFKDSFIRKQKCLKEAYAKYYKLKKQVDDLPDDAGRRIEMLRNDELYRKLINTKLEDEDFING